MMNDLKRKLLYLGAPRHFYLFCGQALPWFLLLSILTMSYGLIGGLFLAPPDYQQGEGFRIIYVHVPCAVLSLMIYVAIAVFSGIYLIWRIKIVDVLAYCLAPIGTFFTLAALITGAIWGKPMWGTWWIWDARLTSELILLFLYGGYIGLYQGLGQKKSAAKASAILAVIGLIDIPIIHYSVYWWSTLHQGTTVFKLQPSIAPAMLYPLLSMLVGLACYAGALLCIRVRTEILRREADNYWISVLIKKMA